MCFRVAGREIRVERLPTRTRNPLGRHGPGRRHGPSSHGRQSPEPDPAHFDGPSAGSVSEQQPLFYPQPAVAGGGSGSRVVRLRRRKPNAAVRRTRR